MDRRTNFERDGFVTVSAFYNEDELQAVNVVLERFIAERVPFFPP